MPLPNAVKTDAVSDLGVYVHFPWCLKKCPYCDFLSVAAERPSLPHDEALRNAPKKAGGLFIVPKIVE